MYRDNGDSKLSVEDQEFLIQVRTIANDIVLYFTFSINPLVHNGALLAYHTRAMHQKVFHGPRNIEMVRLYLEAYRDGQRYGRDEARRGFQSELRSLCGISEYDGVLSVDG